MRRETSVGVRRVRGALVVVLSMLIVLALATVMSAGTSGAGASPVARCTSAQLRVSIGRANGAAGTIYYPIVFTNEGARCAIWGVPSVQPVGVGRRPVGPPATNASVGQMPRHLVVGLRQSVSAGFGVAETGNYPAARCGARSIVGVRISVAGFVGTTVRPLRTSVCTRVASTHTQLLVAGTSGAGA